MLTSSPSLTGAHCKSGLVYVQSVHFGGFRDKIAGTAVVMDGRDKIKRPRVADFEADAGGQALVLLEFPQCRIRRDRLVPAKTPKLI